MEAKKLLDFKHKKLNSADTSVNFSPTPYFGQLC